MEKGVAKIEKNWMPRLRGPGGGGRGGDAVRIRLAVGKEWEPRRKHASPQRSCRDCKWQHDTMEWRTD